MPGTVSALARLQLRPYVESKTPSSRPLGDGNVLLIRCISAPLVLLYAPSLVGWCLSNFVHRPVLLALFSFVFLFLVWVYTSVLVLAVLHDVTCIMCHCDNYSGCSGAQVALRVFRVCLSNCHVSLGESKHQA